jgi:methanethiol S-methyltransferase
MSGTGFWWIILAAAGYGIVHSILAANSFKARVARWVGQSAYQRFYRLFFVFMAVVTLLPVLSLTAQQPDRVIYTIPTPWVYLTVPMQVLALVALAYGVLQTGGAAFLGFQQFLDFNSQRSQPKPEKLVTNGLFRWVRHPLYTFSFIFIWLTPVMSWNLLGLNIALSAYMLVGSIFEERKLAEQFGQEYENYREKTPRIVPGLKTRR